MPESKEACIACRASKVRCEPAMDGGKCSRCVRLCLECISAGPSRRGRPGVFGPDRFKAAREAGEAGSSSEPGGSPPHSTRPAPQPAVKILIAQPVPQHSSPTASQPRLVAVNVSQSVATQAATAAAAPPPVVAVPIMRAQPMGAGVGRAVVPLSGSAAHAQTLTLPSTSCRGGNGSTGSAVHACGRAPTGMEAGGSEPLFAEPLFAEPLFAEPHLATPRQLQAQLLALQAHQAQLQSQIAAQFCGVPADGWPPAPPARGPQFGALPLGTRPLFPPTLSQPDTLAERLQLDTERSLAFAHAQALGTTAGASWRALGGGGQPGHRAHPALAQPVQQAQRLAPQHGAGSPFDDARTAPPPAAAAPGRPASRCAGSASSDERAELAAAAARALYASTPFAPEPAFDSATWWLGSELSLLFENLAAATPEMPRRSSVTLPTAGALVAPADARRLDDAASTREADARAARYASATAPRDDTSVPPRARAPLDDAGGRAPLALGFALYDDAHALADAERAAAQRRSRRPTLTDGLHSVPEASAAEPAPLLPPLALSLAPADEAARARGGKTARGGVVKRDCSGKAALGKKTGSGRRPRSDSEAEAQRICAEMDELQSLLSGEFGRELGADSFAFLNSLSDGDLGLGSDELVAQMSLALATESA